MSAYIPGEYLKYLTKEDMKDLMELTKMGLPDDVIENAVKETVKRNGGEDIGRAVIQNEKRPCDRDGRRMCGLSEP